MTAIQYQIASENTGELEKTIKRGLSQFNHQQLGEKGSHFVISAISNENVIAGLIIEQCSDAFYFKSLWVDAQYRNQGIGAEMVKMALERAQSNNIGKIFTDTYQFQARRFYEKQGFKVIGIVPKYMLGHDKIYLKRELL